MSRCKITYTVIHFSFKLKLVDLLSKIAVMYMKSSGISVYCLTINVHISEKNI